MATAGKIARRDPQIKADDDALYRVVRLMLFKGRFDQARCAAGAITDKTRRDKATQLASRLSWAGAGCSQEDWEHTKEVMNRFKLKSMQFQCLHPYMHLRESYLLTCLICSGQNENITDAIDVCTTLKTEIEEIAVLARRYHIKSSAVRILREAQRYHLGNLKRRLLSANTKK